MSFPVSGCLLNRCLGTGSSLQVCQMAPDTGGALALGFRPLSQGPPRGSQEGFCSDRSESTNNKRGRDVFQPAGEMMERGGKAFLRRGIRGTNHLPDWAGGQRWLCSCSSRARASVTGDFCLLSERGQNQASWFPSPPGWAWSCLHGSQKIKTNSLGRGGRSRDCGIPLRSCPRPASCPQSLVTDRTAKIQSREM